MHQFGVQCARLAPDRVANPEEGKWCTTLVQHHHQNYHARFPKFSVNLSGGAWYNAIAMHYGAIDESSP